MLHSSVGVIAGSITLNPIIIDAIGISGILIQRILSIKKLEHVVEMIDISYKTIDSILIDLKNIYGDIHLIKTNYLLN